MSGRYCRGRTVALAVCVIGLGMSAGAFAGGATHLQVTARVNGRCSVTTGAGRLDFHTIDPSSGANATASETLSMKCSAGTVPAAAIDDGGLHGSGGTRRMLHPANPAAVLPYSITYSNDAGFTGAGLGAAAPSHNVTINGKITPAHLRDVIAAIGAQGYTDTVIITINP